MTADGPASVPIVAYKTTAIPHKLKEKKTADPNRPARNGTHSSYSSVSTEKVSLSPDVESPDDSALSGMSTEIGRMSALALNRAAWVSTGMDDRSEGTRRALKRIRKCISTCAGSSV